MPVSEILDFNIWGSLAGAVMIATLAMQGFGKDFAIWIDSIVTQWYIGAMALLFGIIFGVIYSAIMKYLGKSAKVAKEKSAAGQTSRDRSVIHADAKVAEKDLRNY